MSEENKIEKLVTDLSENRNAMYGMLEDVIEFRKNIHNMIPKKVDFANRFVMDEKMKIISNILGTELDIRKQIDVSIREEVNIRSKFIEDQGENTRENVEIISRLIESGAITVRNE